MPYTFEEKSEENRKRFIKIGLISIFSLIFIFVLLKIFVFKPKKIEEGGPKVEIPSQFEMEEVKYSWPEQKRVKIFSDVFLELINIENYEVEGVTSSQGFKFISLEIELENKTDNSVEIIPWGQSLVGDKGEEIYSPIFSRIASDPSSPLSVKTRKPDINANVVSGKRIERKTIEKGYISFQVPENIRIKEVVFQIPKKKIIFQIP